MPNRLDRAVSYILGILSGIVVLLCFVIVLSFAFQALPTDAQQWENLWTEANRIFLNRILRNTLLITLLSLLVSAPIAFFAALCIAYELRGTVKRFCSSFVRIVSSLPAVLIGLVVASVFADFLFSGEYLLLSAVFTLSLIVMPTLCDEFLLAMNRIKENELFAADSMGATHFQKLRYLIFPHISKRVLSALLLGFCRGIGESTALFIICSLFSYYTGDMLQYTFASYILSCFVGGVPAAEQWQLVSCVTMLFTIFYYLLFFIQQRLQGGDR